MGSDKALLDVGGSAMVVRVAAAMRQAGCEVLAVGRDALGFGLAAAPDDAPGGPAAGLATGLRFAAGRPVFLAATDQPMLRAETVAALLAIDGPAVVPIDAEVRQTMCAVYRSDCIAPLNRLRAASEGPSLQRLLTDVGAREVPEAVWREWGEDGRSWWSIDTPEDLAEVRLLVDRGRPTG